MMVAVVNIVLSVIVNYVGRKKMVIGVQVIHNVFSYNPISRFDINA